MGREAVSVKDHLAVVSIRPGGLEERVSIPKRCLFLEKSEMHSLVSSSVMRWFTPVLVDDPPTRPAWGGLIRRSNRINARPDYGQRAVKFSQGSWLTHSRQRPSPSEKSVPLSHCEEETGARRLIIRGFVSCKTLQVRDVSCQTRSLRMNMWINYNGQNELLVLTFMYVPLLQKQRRMCQKSLYCELMPNRWQQGTL